MPTALDGLCPADPDRAPPWVDTLDGAREMRFDRVLLQSRMRLDQPWALDVAYTRFMMAALLWAPRPERVLVIGLGGGSLPKYIHHTLPETDVTAVEINPQVIACRAQFQVPEDGPRFRVIEADGADFLARGPGPWDWILIDAFNAEGQAPALCTPACYAQARAQLTAQGLMVANLEADDALDRCYLDRMASAFGHAPLVLPLPEGGNQVALAGPAVSEPPPTLRDARRAHAALAAVHRQTLAEVLPVVMRVLGRL